VVSHPSSKERLMDGAPWLCWLSQEKLVRRTY